MEALETKHIPAQNVISIQHTGSYSEIGSVYHRLHEWAREVGVTITGPGFTRFLSPPNEFDLESAMFEVCLPIGGDVQGDGPVTVKQMPACTVAYSRVQGPHGRIPAHYTEMFAWLSAQGMETSGPPREVYIKRPDALGKGDPREFVTEIQLPVNQ